MATKRKRDSLDFCSSSTTTESVNKKSRVSEEQTMVNRLNEIHKKGREILVEQVPSSASSSASSMMLDVTKELHSFNQEYHVKSKMMGKATECAHPVISSLLSTIRGMEHNSDPLQMEFRQEVYFLLGLLSRNELGGQTVLDEGGFDLLLSHLRLSQADDVGFGYCCYALGNVLTGSQVNIGETCRIVRSENILPFALDHLRQRMDNWQLAQQVFFALGNLAFISDFELDMLDNGAIELAVRFLKLHPYRVEMAIDVVFFLKNLAFGDKGRLEMIKLDAINNVLNVLAANCDNADLVEITLNLFFNLSFSGAIPILTKTSQPLCLFVHLIKHHRYNALPLKECIRTLVRIYLHSSTSVRATIVQNGFIDCLTHLYSLYQPFLIQNEENRNKSNECDMWEEPNANGTDTNDETNLELFFQIETAFKKIALVPIPTYERVPSDPPSLSELSIRAIKKYMNTKDVDISPHDTSIPEDIHSQLSSCKNCDFCESTYHSHEVNVIYPGPFAPLSFLVPKYWSLCSEQCLASVKAQAKKSLPGTNTIRATL